MQKNLLQTEKKRQVALTYIKEIIDVLRECFLIIDSDLKVIAANELFYQTFNVKREETEGQYIFDLGNKQWNIPELKILLTDVIPKQGVISDYEVRHSFETIGEKIMLLNAKQIESSSMIIVAIEDVTEKKRSSIYVRSLIEASLDPLVTISADGKITDVNEGSIKVTGRSRDELIGTDFSDYFTEPIKAREGYKQVFAKGLVMDYPLTIRHKNGTLTDVLYNASVYKDSNDNVLGVFAAARDVTVKKALEQKLAEHAITQEVKIVERTAELAHKVKEFEEANAKYEATLLSLGAAIVVVDKEGKIDFVNKAFEELLGWNQEEILGKSMVEIIPREDESGIVVPYVERILSEVLAGKKITTTTIIPFDTSTIPLEPVVVLPVYYYIRKDKTRFPAAGSISPILLKGEIVGAVEVFRDITKEQELDKSKSDFISLAAHQLRTPLSSISWYTEMLLDGDGGELNEAQKKYFDQITKATDRMVGMVKSFLNVALLDVGEVIIRDEHTDVGLLINDVIDEQKKDILKKEIVLVYNHARNLPLIVIDHKRLRMVLQNLLSNAIKYTEKNGSVHITTSILNQEKNMLLTIKDNGIGIPQASQKKIFTKFFRAENVVQRSTDGTGLGMYLAKNIVENSGGKIWFESTENVGTTFYVTLPL